jgi:hypothetical protein
MSDENVKDLVIRINPNSTEATVVVERGGVTAQKTVSIDDLAASLSANHQINTGILPRGTRYYAGSGTNFTICTEAAPRVRNIVFDYYARRQAAIMNGKDKDYKPSEISIPFPACLFMFVVKGGKLRSSKVAAVKQTLTATNDMVYRFPFGNTFHDGRVCWGYNDMPNFEKPMDAVSLMALFFDAPFNGDLLDSRTVSEFKDGRKHITDALTLIKHIEGKEKFPEEALCNLCTFSKLIGDQDG